MKFFILVGFLFCSIFLRAQKDQDTVKQIHPYKKSMYFSAICPGLGQVRNATLSPKKFKQAYWKVPLIYGLLGSSIYMIIDNNMRQNAIKQEYFSRESGNTPSIEWIAYDSYGLISLQQQYLNNRDLFILLTLGLHALQILDAGVEAHFLNFNVDDNISFHLKPKFLNSSIMMTASLNF